MSYILEALRKAERERNAGQPPDLQQVVSQTATTARKKPLTRRWLTLAAASLIILIIGATLWFRSARVTVISSSPSVASAVVAPAPAAAAGITTETAVAETSTGHLDDLLDKSSGDSLPLEDQQQLSAQTAPIQAAPAPEVKPAQPIATTPAVTAAQSVENPSQAEQAQAEPELPPELKRLKEMPPDYRNNFPSIRVDVHAYDEKPAKRFVMVNGRRYREGEVLIEGPRIVSIEEDGIVFNYRNADVLYPIGR
jgi:general secretion pathway protein B